MRRTIGYWIIISNGCWILHDLCGITGQAFGIVTARLDWLDEPSCHISPLARPRFFFVFVQFCS